MSNNDYVHIDVNSSSSIFVYILKYGATFDNIKNYTSDFIKFKKYEENPKKKYKVELRLPYGISKINYKDKEIIINYYKDPNTVGLSHSAKRYESINIKTKDSIDLLKKFIKDAREFCNPQYSNYVVIKTYKNYWNTLSRLPSRSIDTIYLNKKDKDKLIDDLDDFINSEDKYHEYGIPYKRTYLFEGKPGTGKTSLIFAIASMLKMNIGIVTFGPDMDDSNFMNAISSLPENYILLLEDVDGLFIERSSASKSFLSFSTMLNTLDGMGRKNKLLTFITTNYVEKLDKALIRPGRIDYILTFDSSTKEQIKVMFEKYRPKEIDKFDEFYEIIKNKKITIAILQKFFFDCRKKENIIKNIKYLYDIIESHKQDSDDYIIDTMYS
jgi:mitochondrial chaperone BCS1